MLAHTARGQSAGSCKRAVPRGLTAGCCVLGGDEQCILARCLTQLGSGAWKRGNSPLPSAITGRGGRGIGLSGGTEGIIVQIGHAHQRGVTTAAPEPQSLQAGPQERWVGSFSAGRGGLCQEDPEGPCFCAQSTCWARLEPLPSFRPQSRSQGPSTSQAWNFPGVPVVKNPPPNAGNASLIPGQGTKIPSAVGQPSPCAIPREPT